MAAVGAVLWPDMQYLPRILPLLERADYIEVCPETLWGPGGQPNAYHGIAATLADGGTPLVAHGVGLDPASADADRRRTWLCRLQRDAGRLGLRWISDHLGTTMVAGEPVALPLPAPASFQRLRRCLDQVHEATGAPAGIENSAWYAYPGDALDEARQLSDALGEQHHLVLDLHNLYTNAINLDFDPMLWLDRAPLDRVIEVHLAGGTWAPEAWTAGRAVRLDSHDDAVPDEVWALLDAALPRCTGLRGATLERIDGPVTDEEVDRLCQELERLRHAVADVGLPLPPAPQVPSSLPPVALSPLSPKERVCAEALAALVRDPPRGDAGLGVAHHLVVKLRFGRLMRGSVQAEAWFERDPQTFVEAFRRFHREVPCAETPWEEAARWTEFGAHPR